MTSIYITTTIPYVNARPHLGFALELVQGDALARYRRQLGDQVRFQTLLRACQAVGRYLAPFLPDAAARITRQCAPGEGGLLPAPAPLLPRIGS